MLDLQSVAQSGITPGNWLATHWTNHAATTIVADLNGVRTVVAECSGHGRMTQDCLADARLMAAAKKLLVAAQASWNCICELPPTQARVEVAQLLQGAIEQATGSPA